MATPVIMPRQGQSVESCIISKWHKAKGDKVQVGDVLFSYETDKAAFDEEAKVSGTLLDIFFVEGDDVPCLTNVCVIGNEGESTAEFNPNAQGNAQSGEKVQQTASEAHNTANQEERAPAAVIAAAADSDEKIRISPRARNLAEKTGVDYRYAAPSGPYGRIIEQDIIALREKGPIVTSAAKDEYLKSAAQGAVSGTGLNGRITTNDLGSILDSKGFTPALTQALDAVPAAVPEYEEVKLTNIRKVIAKAMHHSISSTAQLTLNTSFDATDILGYRKKLKDSKENLGIENITLNDMILYAVSRTLLYHKDLNAHFLDDKMLVFRNVHLGFAADTERGLMVPTIFNANLRSLNEISAEVKKLAEECQKGTISPDKTKGASFTISNLGSLGIESFTPVLNPPQTGILGVSNIVQRVREVKGQYQYYPAMGLSLTFDHRALDGAPAARFLQQLVANLENFSVLLVK